MKLTHPDGGSITVRDDMADIYLGAGWTAAEATTKRAYTRRTTKAAAPPSAETNKKAG